ncbi:hypothetical protein evm_011525 [Chilo suppressalis]|nr:hypothetical protein evm_011525 [Chilo suppressalis]
MMFVGILCLVCLCSINSEASTHWMVTESGLIQPKEESPFEMENPHDLLAFLSQDTRWEHIINLHHDLAKRQTVAASLWSDIQKNSDVTTLILKEDSCQKAGQLNYLDWYASFLEEGKSKKIPDEEYLLYKPFIGQDVDVPDCKKISSLTFSMFAFEHLEGMMHRGNLTASPEMALPELISPIMTVDQFGHWLALCLKKNSSSWLHYNMASMYWRVRGNAPKAMECSRRALHYAPRQYKDVALLNLGSILHRSKKTEDAITVLGAAIDHDPHYNINHFILATAYAVLGEYNTSLKHLDICMELDPTFEMAERYRYGVVCHYVLLQRMNVIRKIVNELREELIEYTSREAHWLKLQAAFLRTRKHEPDNGNISDFRNVIKNAEKMSELTGLKMKDLKKEGDRYSVIQYFLDGPVSISEKLQDKGVFALDSAYSLQRLVKHIEKHANMASNYVQPDLSKLMDAEVLKEIERPNPDDYVSKYMNPHIKGLPTMNAKDVDIDLGTLQEKKASQTKGDYSEYFTGSVLYPPSLRVNRNLEDFDREHVWPSNRLCKETESSYPKHLDAIYPVFLPFENKGIKLGKLLSDKIGVPADVEHELPWYPPQCPQDKDATAFLQKKNPKNNNNMNKQVVDTGYLRNKLLEYAGDGDVESVMHMQEVELGHRIYIAMQKKLAPDWILYTLASLYWRVRGNNANAMHCLMSANKKVDPKLKDLVLASIASLYVEMGHFDESLTATEEGFKLGLHEPVLNFILAELNMLRKHRNTHIFHLKQVVRVDPKFMGGLARNLLNGWACLMKQINTMAEVGLSEDICTQVEPGVNMVCGKDGTNCHVTNIECYKPQDKESTSTLVRLLGMKDKKDKEPEVMDDSMFDEFKLNMPKDRSDKIAHQRNYDLMRESVNTALRGCGRLGCHDIQPEDLELTEDDCTYQHLELSYWLHTVNFRQLIVDHNLRLPTEIASVTPSKMKVPECRISISPSDDFFLERMSRVDSTGWKPILGLMHQFAEVFEFYDYVSLGAKISKYVDTKPHAWDGLVAAGWWCGAGGRAACAVRCLSAAHHAAPPDRAPEALRVLATLLNLQLKQDDAKDIAYLSFYTSPKNKIDAFLVGVSHSYKSQYEQAVWMYRFALTFDADFLPAKACLHATMCIMLFGDSSKEKNKRE